MQRRLGTTLRGDRAYSLATHFPDAWYDLSNSGLLPQAQRLKARFKTNAADLPPNVANPRIENVVLGLVRADDFSDEIGPLQLSFDGAGGGATTIGGIISTRRSNGASLIPIIGKSPTGEWQINLSTGNPADDKALAANFEKKRIKDVVLQLSFVGDAPPWPD